MGFNGGDNTMGVQFAKGEFVVYGKNGVCCVDDIKTMLFAGVKGTYYILKPRLNAGSTVYVPTEREDLVSKLRPVISKKRVDEILLSATEDEILWNDSKNERAVMFGEILSSGDCNLLMKLLVCIYNKKAEKESCGKHISSTDENAFRLARELIEDEFSFVLGCTAEKAEDYIANKFA